MSERISSTNPFVQIVDVVDNSEYRSSIIKHLSSCAATPTQIWQDLRLRNRAQVSRTLNELANLGLVEPLVDNVRKGKLYRITKKGYLVAYTLRRIKRKAKSGSAIRD